MSTPAAGEGGELLAQLLLGRADGKRAALDLACELMDSAVAAGDEPAARGYADARAYMYRHGWDRAGS